MAHMFQDQLLYKVHKVSTIQHALQEWLWAHFSILIHELLNKDTDIVPEAAPLTILDSKSAVCMDNNGKDANHTRHISRRVPFLRNCEKYKTHKI